MFLWSYVKYKIKIAVLTALLEKFANILEPPQEVQTGKNDFRTQFIYGVCNFQFPLCIIHLQKDKQPGCLSPYK